MLHMALAGLLPILILSAVHGLTPYLVLIAIDGVAHAQGGWSEQGSIQTTVGTRLLGVFLPAALTLAASLAALLWQRIELSRSSITPAHFGASRLFRLLLLLASALAGAWLIVVGFPLVDPSFASGIAFQFDRYVLTLTLLSLATLLSGLVARALAPGRLDPESHSHGQWWRVSRVAGLLFWYFFAGFLLLYSASSLVSAFMDDPLATVPVPGSWLVDLNDHVNRVLAMIAAGAQRPVFGASPLISTTWFVYFVAAYVAMGLLFDSWHEAARTDSRPIAWLCGSPARIGLWIYETLYALLATLAAVPAVVLLSLIIVHVQNVGLPY
jgi:hypothetical protein